MWFMKQKCLFEKHKSSHFKVVPPSLCIQLVVHEALLCQRDTEIFQRSIDLQWLDVRDKPGCVQVTGVKFAALLLAIAWDAVCII